MNLVFLLVAFTFLFSVQAIENNLVMVASTSKFWLNYRHTVNALLIYQELKRRGYQDDQIILAIPDNACCHPRNPYPGQIFDGFHKNKDLANGLIEIDWRFLEANALNLEHVLAGRINPLQARSKFLNKAKNLLIYMLGHGGDEYLKVQDTQVIRSVDLELVLSEMEAKKRYEDLLFITDTCQANSWYKRIKVDFSKATFIGSSILGQMAKSIHYDPDVGQTMSDRFSFYFSEYLQNLQGDDLQNKTLQNILDYCDLNKLRAY